MILILASTKFGCFFFSDYLSQKTPNLNKIGCFLGRNLFYFDIGLWSVAKDNTTFYSWPKCKVQCFYLVKMS